MELNMKKFAVVLLSTILVSCGDTEHAQETFFNTLTIDGKAPEGSNVVKQLSPENNTITVSWSAEKGYSSKIYLSTSEHLLSSLSTSDFQEGVDFINSFEAGEGVDVSVKCQVDQSYTVFECVSSEEHFGTNEKLMNQLLPDTNNPILYLIVHHYEEYDGASTAVYGLIFTDN